MRIKKPRIYWNPRKQLWEAQLISKHSMLLGRAWMQVYELSMVDNLNRRQGLMKLTEIKLMAKTREVTTKSLPTSVAHPRKRMLKNNPGHSKPQMKCGFWIAILFRSTNRRSLWGVLMTATFNSVGRWLAYKTNLIQIHAWSIRAPRNRYNRRRQLELLIKILSRTYRAITCMAKWIHQLVHQLLNKIGKG